MSRSRTRRGLCTSATTSGARWRHWSRAHRKADPSELGESSNWRLWTVNLETGTGAPIEGLGFKPGGYNDVHIGERTLIRMPSADYARTTAYELVDGSAVSRFSTQGSSYHMVELSF